MTLPRGPRWRQHPGHLRGGVLRDGLSSHEHAKDEDDSRVRVDGPVGCNPDARLLRIAAARAMVSDTTTRRAVVAAPDLMAGSAESLAARCAMMSNR